MKVSPGCKFCYAEGWAKRTGKDIWGKDAAREHASEAYWKGPVKWNAEAAKTGEPFRVFCASLADVCEDREDLLEPRARLMRLIEATPALTWLLCTKRPENFLRHFGRRWGAQWPRNVWALTTAENQEQADKRIPHLLEVPAIVRGVSYEPALGPVDFLRYQPKDCNVMYHTSTGTGPGSPHICRTHGTEFEAPHPCPKGRGASGIHWLIVGGESGGGARPFYLDWARDTIDQARASGAAPFVKQLGARPINGREDGCIIRQAKGDDMDEWPSDLRVQEFPKL